MPKKDFSFHYDIKTKTGKMKLKDKYIKLGIKEKHQTASADIFFCSSSGISGYGLNLLWEDK